MGVIATRSVHAGPSAQTFFHPKSYFFGELEPHAKFKNPRTTPSGRKVMQGEERRRENAVHSRHLVLCRARKPLGPKKMAQF